MHRYISPSLSTYIYIYISIHIYLSLSLYIYIYIYTHVYAHSSEAYASNAFPDPRALSYRTHALPENYDGFTLFNA